VTNAHDIGNRLGTTASHVIVSHREGKLIRGRFEIGRDGERYTVTDTKPDDESPNTCPECGHIITDEDAAGDTNGIH